MLKTLDVVCAILEQDGKILLAQRPAHADQPGMWEFAGGKVESGETQPAALHRELREELGIEAQCRSGLSLYTPGTCRRLPARPKRTITANWRGALRARR